MNNRKKTISENIKKEYDDGLKKIIQDEVTKELLNYMTFATQITGRPVNSDEMQNLFQSWDNDPTLAYEWLRFRTGKSDDFSLIALQVKPSSP